MIDVKCVDKIDIGFELLMCRKVDSKDRNIMNQWDFLVAVCVKKLSIFYLTILLLSAGNIGKLLWISILWIALHRDHRYRIIFIKNIFIPFIFFDTFNYS